MPGAGKPLSRGSHQKELVLPVPPAGLSKLGVVAGKERRKQRSRILAVRPKAVPNQSSFFVQGFGLGDAAPLLQSGQSVARFHVMRWLEHGSVCHPTLDAVSLLRSTLLDRCENHSCVKDLLLVFFDRLVAGSFSSVAFPFISKPFPFILNPWGVHRGDFSLSHSCPRQHARGPIVFCMVPLSLTQPAPHPPVPPHLGCSRDECRPHQAWTPSADAIPEELPRNRASLRLRRLL